MSVPKIDITGNKYGRLIPLTYIGKGIWECICDCGNTTQAEGTAIRCGKRLSCGCAKTEASKANGAISAMKHRKNSKEHKVLVLYKIYKNNSQKREIPFELTLAEFSDIIFKPCHYCGVEGEVKDAGKSRYLAKAKIPGRTVDRKYADTKTLFCNGADRKDNNKPYTVCNTVPCCSICNHAKHNLPYDTFINWLKRVSTKWGNNENIS